MCGKKFGVFRKKTLIIILSAILVVSFFIYWLVFAPIITRVFCKDAVYQGIEYYANEYYLEFENGHDFKKILEHEISSKNCMYEDFCYIDTKVEDNPFYGKMGDIYALDVILMPEEYNAYLSHIESIAVESDTRDDFVLHAIPNHVDNNNYITVIAFCEESSVVRYIMITETDTTGLFNHIFSNQGYLNWKKKTRDGCEGTRGRFSCLLAR